MEIPGLISAWWAAAAPAENGSVMSIPVAMVSVGLLVFLAHLFYAIFQRFRMPDTVWLIGIGILLGPVFQVLKPTDFGVVGAVFTTIALVVILFEAGLDLSFKSLRESLASTMRITLGCYVLTTAAITAAVYSLGDFPLITALFIGAVIAGPSPPVIIPMVKSLNPVSYTHLTLPTNREVQISVGAVSLKKKHKLKVWLQFNPTSLHRKSALTTDGQSYS